MPSLKLDEGGTATLRSACGIHSTRRSSAVCCPWWIISASACVALACAVLSACDPDVDAVRIAAQDFRFVPALVRLSTERPARLEIVNEGREVHELDGDLFRHAESPGSAVDPAPGGAIRIAPGGRAVVTLTAPAGTYLFRCRVRGHARMTGTVVVE
ncbi:cupredoxin domain-containing protein [Candidatus Nitrospira bockiana]